MTEELVPLLNMIVYSVCGIGIVMALILRSRMPKRDDDTSNTPKVRNHLECLTTKKHTRSFWTIGNLSQSANMQRLTEN